MLSHHLLTSFTESGDVIEHIPGALSDLLDPFLEDDVGDPDYDLRLWSWLPAPAVCLAKVSPPILVFPSSALRHYIRLL